MYVYLTRFNRHLF